jgi:hypothetical protein
VSHTIHSLSFGDIPVPGVISPLEGTTKISASGQQRLKVATNQIFWKHIGANEKIITPSVQQ